MFRGQGTTRSNILKTISLIVLFIFIPQTLFAQVVLSGGVTLPTPGTMVSLSQPFHPAVVKGLKVYPDNPLRFDFILDKGDAFSQYDPERPTGAQGLQLKKESEKLIKYFLASLTIPEKDLWVNLSPYEKDRIIPEAFGQTDMGRDLLAQDYILKQITSSLMYPESKLGKKFWDEIYKKSYELYGVTNVPVDTFNKVWIVPDKAVVYENQNRAFVVEAKLKVMLEEDYVAAQQTKDHRLQTIDQPSAEKRSVVSGLGSSVSDLTRSVILPAIEKEVNEGQQFAQLRQVYYSLILATWFKRNLRESIFGKAYVGKNKIAGVDIKDKEIKEKIYAQYLESFKKGAYNYIKEEYDPATKSVIPRKYFSGGFGFEKMDAAMTTTNNYSDLLKNTAGLVVIESKIDKTTANMSHAEAIKTRVVKDRDWPQEYLKGHVYVLIKKADFVLPVTETVDEAMTGIATKFVDGIGNLTVLRRLGDARHVVYVMREMSTNKTYFLKILPNELFAEEWLHYRLAKRLKVNIPRFFNVSPEFYQDMIGVPQSLRSPGTSRGIITSDVNEMGIDDLLEKQGSGLEAAFVFIQFSLHLDVEFDGNLNSVMPTIAGKQRFILYDFGDTFPSFWITNTPLRDTEYTKQNVKTRVSQKWELYKDRIDPQRLIEAIRQLISLTPDEVKEMALESGYSSDQIDLARFERRKKELIPEIITVLEEAQKDSAMMTWSVKSLAALGLTSLAAFSLFVSPVSGREHVSISKPAITMGIGAQRNVDLSGKVFNVTPAQYEDAYNMPPLWRSFSYPLGEEGRDLSSFKSLTLSVEGHGNVFIEFEDQGNPRQRASSPVYTVRDGKVVIDVEQLRINFPHVNFQKIREIIVNVGNRFYDIELNAPGADIKVTGTPQFSQENVSHFNPEQALSQLPTAQQIENQHSQQRQQLFESLTLPDGHLVQQSDALSHGFFGGRIQAVKELRDKVLNKASDRRDALTLLRHELFNPAQNTNLRAYIYYLLKDVLKAGLTFDEESLLENFLTRSYKVTDPIAVKFPYIKADQTKPDFYEFQLNGGRFDGNGYLYGVEGLPVPVEHMVERIVDGRTMERLAYWSILMNIDPLKMTFPIIYTESLLGAFPEKQFNIMCIHSPDINAQLSPQNIALRDRLLSQFSSNNPEDFLMNKIIVTGLILMQDGFNVHTNNGSLASRLQGYNGYGWLKIGDETVNMARDPRIGKRAALIGNSLDPKFKDIVNAVAKKIGYQVPRLPQNLKGYTVGIKNIVSLASVSGKQGDFAMTVSAPQMFGHRGAFDVSQGIFENSLESFRRAMVMGLDGFELDVRLNENGVLIVVHPKAASTVKTPTFQEVFDLVKNSKIQLQVHIQDMNSVNKVVEFIAQNKFEKRVTISSTNLDILKKVRSRNQTIATAFILKDLATTKLLLRDAQEAKITLLDLSLRDPRDILTKDVVDLIHSAGIKVNAGFKLLDEQTAQKMVGFGVDRIISESPETMKNLKDSLAKVDKAMLAGKMFRKFLWFFAVPFIFQMTTPAVVSAQNLNIKQANVTFSVPLTYKNGFSPDFSNSNFSVSVKTNIATANVWTTGFLKHFYGSAKLANNNFTVNEKTLAQIKVGLGLISDEGLGEATKEFAATGLKKFVGSVDRAIVTDSKAVQRPLVDNPIDPVKAKQWVAAQGASEIRDLAQFLLNHVTHVSQKEFETALQETVNDFNANMGDKPYILVFPSENEDRSIGWTYQLALEKGLKPAQHVIRLDQLDVAQQISKTGVHDIVLIDDAVYSGHQMLSHVRKLFKAMRKDSLDSSDFNFHFVTPFMSAHVEEKFFSQLRSFHYKAIFKALFKGSRRSEGRTVFYKHRSMPNLSQIFRSEPKREALFKQLVDMPKILYEFMTLTYFQHKVADGLSMVDWLSKGSVHTEFVIAGSVYKVKENEKNIKAIRFIPETIPPYEKNYLEKVQGTAGSEADRAMATASTTVQRPLVDNPIDVEKSKQWVAAQGTPELRDLAQFLLNHVTHITQKEFEAALENMVNDFNSKLGDKPYVLIMPRDKGERSESWTYQLALEKGLKPAQYIIKTDGGVLSYDQRILKDVKNVVFIDDAFYSGTQVLNASQALLSHITVFDPQDINIHFLTPFMTSFAQNKILTNPKAFVYQHQTMPTISDILASNAEYEKLFKTLIYENIDRGYPGITLTYFQHKVADSVSVLSWVFGGYVYEQKRKVSNQTIPFIPGTFPPYTEGYLNIIKMYSSNAVKNNADGAMTTSSTEVQRPLKDNPIDMEKAKQWVEAHKDPHLRDLAQFLLSHVTHVSQKEFEEALQETVDDFNSKIGDKPYVLLLPQWNGNRSEWWTYQLALEKGLKPAKDIIKMAAQGASYNSYLAMVQQIRDAGKDVVLIDDAVYSGVHMLDIVQRLFGDTWGNNPDSRDLNFHFVAPFMSTNIEERIFADSNRSGNRNVYFYKHRFMQTLSEIFRSEPERRKWFEIFFGMIDYFYSYRTLTYFQHKVPDFLSMFDWITQGNIYEERQGALERDAAIKFIPETIPPYEEDYLKKIKSSSSTDKAMAAQSAVQRPVVDNPINWKKANQWVAAQGTQELRGLAQFLLNHVTHVSQKEFEEALQETVNDFNSKIGDKPYILLLRTRKGIRSEWWTYQLALEKGLKPAKHIIKVGFPRIENKPSAWLEKYFQAIIKQMKATGIKDVVRIDDAVYSGLNMESDIRNLLWADNMRNDNDSFWTIDEYRQGTDGFKLHFVAPFMSSVGEDKLKGLNSQKVSIYQHRSMKTLPEIFHFEPEQEKVFKKLFGGIYADVTLTYFQHKVPDHISTLNFVTEGNVPKKENGHLLRASPSIRFIAKTIPPYEKNYLKRIAFKRFKESLIGMFKRKHDRAMTTVQRPVVDNPIDVKKAKKWVEAQGTPELQDFARFLLNHVTHISQKEFEDALQEAVNDFNNKIGDKPYILLLPADKEDRSDGWTYRLALEKGLKPPKHIIRDKRNYSSVIQEIHDTGVKDIVVMDDAVYTATHILGSVEHTFSWYGNSIYKDSNDFQVHFVAPFMSKDIEKRIFSQLKDYNVGQIFVHQHRVMETLPEIFRSEPKYKRIYERIFNELDSSDSYVTLTYFQHKVPDNVSALGYVMDGIVFEKTFQHVVRSIQFIPKTIPPYEENYLEQIAFKRLKESLIRMFKRKHDRAMTTVQRPVVDNSIDLVKAEQWVAAHKDPRIRDLAQFLLDHVNHVTQKKFEEALQETVDDFNAKMGDKPYVLLVPSWRGDRSEWWTYQLALEKGLKPAKNIIRMGKTDLRDGMDVLKEYSQDILKQIRATGVVDIVVMDDAVYTGQRILENPRILLHDKHINPQETKDLNFHVVTPFMSVGLEEKLTQMRQSYYDGGQIFVYKHQTMPTMVSIFQSDLKRKALLEEFFPHLEEGFPYLTLTYFQHKVPDELSLFYWVLKGKIYQKDIHKERPLWIQFIPPTVPPYEENYLEKIKAASATDKAMATTNAKYGGIDFNPEKMDLQVNGSGNAELKALSPAALEELKNAPGFTPVIINIKPVDSLPAFLGLSQAQVDASLSKI
ncbi:MAG: glycerophosphodiester phosphodiesterase [Candidatus Omnitrophica bacterium]|nr:glycerophosphodiester phosphodiesterase [Candidatus Omnitrophota bacterium]